MRKHGTAVIEYIIIWILFLFISGVLAVMLLTSLIMAGVI
jgi:hypothetical protein